MKTKVNSDCNLKGKTRLLLIFAILTPSLFGCVLANPTLVVEPAPLQPITVAIHRSSATSVKLSSMCIIPFDPALPTQSDAMMPTKPPRKVQIDINPARSGEQIAELIERELIQHGLKVIDRKRIEYIMNEKKFNASDLVNNPKQLESIGRFAGCSAVMFGQVGSYGGRYTYKSQGGRIVMTPSYSIGFTFRIVDVINGEVLARGGAGATSRQLLSTTYELSYSDVMSGKAKELPGMDRVADLAVKRAVAPIIEVFNLGK